MELIIVGLVVVIIAFYIVSIFNQLVALKNRFENSFAQIEVQLKRRYDLIPNLVETAKTYMSHEKETLNAVVEARNTAKTALESMKSHIGEAGASTTFSKAEQNLSSALGSLNVTMEAYPELKANQNMIHLSEELTSTENKVAFARQAFNDSIMEYNTYKQSFPQVLFAGAFGHGNDASLLEFEDSQIIQEAPKVNF